jgi:protein SCO1
MISKFKLFLLISIALFFFQCTTESREPVGFAGPETIENGDTMAFTIPSFEFKDQNGKTIKNEDLKGKIYALSFFFTSCPGTCPVVMGNLTAVHSGFKDEPNFQILSVSIDPNTDQQDVLKTYGKGLEIDENRWSLVRNSEEYTHDFIKTRLYQPLIKDKSAPGGFDHSSRVLLVDGKGRLRNFYEGTNKKELDLLIEDAKTLLLEN